MKKTALAALAIAFCAVVGATSCSKNNNDKEQTAELTDSVAPRVDPGEGFAPTTNIRYIDRQRLMQEYNLGKDLQEVIVRNESELQHYHQTRLAEIQKFAQSMEEKYRNNGYLSQISMEQDQQKLQKMQADAEAGMAKKQQAYQQQVEELTYNINVNVQKFLVDYNKEHHFDAILYQDAGAYFNPDLDITTEIIEGLNKVYNQYHEESK